MGEERTWSEFIPSVSELSSSLLEVLFAGEFWTVEQMPELMLSADNSTGKMFTLFSTAVSSSLEMSSGDNSTLGISLLVDMILAGKVELRLFGAAPEFCVAAGTGLEVLAGTETGGVLVEVVYNAMPECMSLAAGMGVSGLEVSASVGRRCFHSLLDAR